MYTKHIHIYTYIYPGSVENLTEQVFRGGIRRRIDVLLIFCLLGIYQSIMFKRLSHIILGERQRFFTKPLAHAQ